MTIRLLADRVAVRRIPAAEETAGGIYIPDRARESTQLGTVTAVGPGRRAPKSGELVPMGIAVGDRVLFSQYAGADVKLDGEEITILREDEVFAVIERRTAN